MTDQTSDFGAPAPIPTLAEEFANQTPPPPSMSRDVIVHPLSGGVLEFDDPTDKLAAALEDHQENTLRFLAEWENIIKAELVRRMDSANTRSEQIGPYILETNAPRTEEITVDAVRDALQPLVDAGVLDAVIMDRVITTPEPKPAPVPSPRVAKVEVNKLKKHPDEKVRAAIDEAITEIPNARILRVKRAPKS